MKSVRTSIVEKKNFFIYQIGGGYVRYLNQEEI
jgi:hypothetical protein